MEKKDKEETKDFGKFTKEDQDTIIDLMIKAYSENVGID